MRETSPPPEPASIISDDAIGEISARSKDVQARFNSGPVHHHVAGFHQTPDGICNRLIANWFQHHFQKGDSVNALVLDAHRVMLLSKS
jgi:hypothetical protein